MLARVRHRLMFALIQFLPWFHRFLVTLKKASVISPLEERGVPRAGGGGHPSGRCAAGARPAPLSPRPHADAARAPRTPRASHNHKEREQTAQEHKDPAHPHATTRRRARPTRRGGSFLLLIALPVLVPLRGERERTRRARGYDGERRACTVKEREGDASLWVCALHEKVEVEVVVKGEGARSGRGPLSIHDVKRWVKRVERDGGVVQIFLRFVLCVWGGRGRGRGRSEEDDGDERAYGWGDFDVDFVRLTMWKRGRRIRRSRRRGIRHAGEYARIHGGLFLLLPIWRRKHGRGEQRTDAGEKGGERKHLMQVLTERDELDGAVRFGFESSSRHADSARNTLSPSSSTHPLGLSTHSAAMVGTFKSTLSFSFSRVPFGFGGTCVADKHQLWYNKPPMVTAALARGVACACVAFPVPTTITRTLRRAPPSQSQSSSASASSQSQEPPTPVPQQQLPEQAGQILSNTLGSVLSPGGGGGLLGGGGDGAGQKKREALKLRLDLNVEVDVQIKAKTVTREKIRIFGMSRWVGKPSQHEETGNGKKNSRFLKQNMQPRRN
ncbi:hypothetical protein B0H13DRAFT_2292685 [Mycena leptocephala]|nr:hypothetical protein B0H13DRAFT_2292685 [Mycena leptocephala]